jgi:CRP-like cAMP-binding protein
MLQKDMEILLKSALFKGITTSELPPLIKCLEPKINTYKKSDLIAVSGDNFSSVGIVLNGEICISKENAAGGRIVMAVLKPGEMFGEIIVFSNQSVWPSTVQAQVDCRIIFIDRERITGVCSKACAFHKTLVRNMLSIISERALMLNRKVEYLTIPGVRGKISAFLLEQHKKKGSATFTLPMNLL